jgi:hypothetical protein
LGDLKNGARGNGESPRPCQFQNTALTPTSWRQCGRPSTGVCEVLQLSCDREDPLTEVIVLKIVELAKAGERDPDILCGKVLVDLATPAEPRRQPALG